ncbi:hypothetical protein ACJX0J_042378, partial [Zea mays]
MVVTITWVEARQIFISHDNPTVEVDVGLSDGSYARGPYPAVHPLLCAKDRMHCKRAGSVGFFYCAFVHWTRQEVLGTKWRFREAEGPKNTFPELVAEKRYSFRASSFKFCFVTRRASERRLLISKGFSRILNSNGQ